MSKFFDLHTVDGVVDSPTVLNVIFDSNVAIPQNLTRKKLIMKNIGSGVVLINVGTAPTLANNLYSLAVDEEMTLEEPGVANAFVLRTAVVATIANLIYREVF